MTQSGAAPGGRNALLGVPTTGTPAGSGLDEMRRGWPLLLPCMAGVALGSGGMPFYTYGLFSQALIHAFGWTTADAQSGLFVFFLTNMALIPMVGWLADRFGAKPVAMVSLVLFSFSFMSLSLMDGRLVTFRLLWFLVAATGTGTMVVTWTRIIGANFAAARGLALGFAFLGTGLAGVFCPPLAAHTIGAAGWRASYVILGLLPLCIALPLAAFLLKPEPRLKLPTAAVAVVEMDGVSIRQALGGVRFWLIAGSFLMIALAQSGVVPNLIRILTSAGRSAGEATLATSLVGGCVILGRLACGALLDRLWAPKVALLFLITAASACAMLAQSHISLTLAAVAGALAGLASGAEGDLLPYLVSRYFGLRHYGALLGISTSLFFLGASLSSVALASVFDATGRYGPGLLGSALLLTTSAGALLLLGAYPRWSAPIDAEVSSARATPS